MSAFNANATVSTRLCRVPGGAVMVTPGTAGDKPIPDDLTDRFVLVLQLSGPKLPSHLRDQFMAMLTPMALGIMAATLAVWAVSHFFGVGFVVDAILVVAGVLTMGYTAFQVGKHLGLAIRLTKDAETADDLDNAAVEMAEVIILLGVEAFLALLTKGAGKMAKSSKAAKAEAGAAKSEQASAKAAKAAKIESAAVHVADDILGLYAKELGIAAHNTAQRNNLREALRYFAEFEKNPRLLKGEIDPKIIDKIGGIDLAHDVEIITLPAGEKVSSLVNQTERNAVHFHHPTSTPHSRNTTTGVGEFLAPKGVPAKARGIDPGMREERIFVLGEPVTVLKSRAGPIGDHWTPGRVVPAGVWPTSPAVSLASLAKDAGKGVPSLSKRAAVKVPGGGPQYYMPAEAWERLSAQGALRELTTPALPTSKNPWFTGRPAK